MAELVNKAQGKKRQQQLGTVVKKRDEIAKRVETARGQGTVATKRIIIGNTRLRAADNSASTTPKTIPTTARNNPISDFRPKSNISSQANLNDLAPPPLPSKAYEEELAKNYSQETVGDLSNQYLQEQISEPQSIDSSEPTDEELNVALQEETPSEILDEELEVLAEEANSDEEIVQQDNIALKDDAISEDLKPPEIPNNELPESEDLGSSLKDPSYDYGSVHRIYGQRIPNSLGDRNKSKNFTEASESSESQRRLKNPQKHNKSTSKPKRGFLFYLVYFLFVASLLTWAGAAYLYFIY